MIGIYLITNQNNQHKYVGQSRDIGRRWKQHLARCKNQAGAEYNKPLYMAFRKYGIESFTFEVLEECNEVELNDKEIFWIQKLNTLTSGGCGYNLLNNLQPAIVACGDNSSHHSLTEADVIDIRTRYKNLERLRDVYPLYKDKITRGGFKKVWSGVNWKGVMSDIYTEELKKKHLQVELSFVAEENGNSKFTVEDVREIRQRRDAGESRASVYKDYKDMVSHSALDDVWLDRKWKNI